MAAAQGRRDETRGAPRRRAAPGRGRRRWLEAALEALRRGGIENVRVERLAAQLGITKGSFYWHFGSRAELLDAMLEFWAHELTDTVFERIRAMPESPRARIAALLRAVVLEGLGRYDPAMRAWARIERRIGAAVSEVDRRRLRAVADLFRAAGLGEADARARAQLFYGYLLGEHATRAGMSRGEREDTLERIAATLVR
jgi:AcrR family transcriptional regulator